MTTAEALVAGMIWGALEEHGITARPVLDGEGNYRPEVALRFSSGTELRVTVTETRSVDAHGCSVVAGNGKTGRRRGRA